MKKLVLSCLLVALTGVSAARASVICVAPTSSAAGSITVTAPITFNITTAGTLGAFVLDEWVTSNGVDHYGNLTPNLAYSVNGTASSTLFNFHDNLGTTVNNVTANDGYFYSQGATPTLAVGNTVTLLAGTYSIPATADFNAQCTQTFNGNLFVTDSSGVALSGVTSAVPEPSTWAAIAAGAGLLGLTLRRRAARA